MENANIGRSREPNPLPQGLGKWIGYGLVGAIVLGLAFTTFYTVQEHEKAAILTFGKYTGETEAGLHFKLPYPIQQVVKVPANKTQRIHIGYREENGQTVSVDEEALMITGDENIVSADAVVEWRISNVRNYLYNIDEPEQFLRNSASASIRSIIGSTPLDYAITEGKTEIQGKVKERLIEIQSLYETGIQIVDIKFQDIEPPEGEVQDAFKDVTNAREEKNTKINEAAKYENDLIPKARGDAQAMIERAESEKKARVLNAKGDVAKFNAVYEEYAKNKEVTKKRLILETLEQVLPGANIVVTDGSGETLKYLPVNELFKSQSKDPKGGAAQ
ncbi:FtsH protease activity modulator HflK [Paenibacillus alkalitolerans]|uniref:FtsH protease activity modulator HflK n=1 Tax=Paenibacillus alkalitolerans TaxID=2799335 RepID=UPI0018F4E4F6|nr:FtsH protease activity modulator HflK [Paenibacillus alkalitolerans]